MGTPSHATGVNSLPPELLDSILGCLACSTPNNEHPFLFVDASTRRDRLDLCSAALVCRTWCLSAQKILQKHITLALDDSPQRVRRFWQNISRDSLLLDRDLQQSLQSLSLTLPTAESGFDLPLPQFLSDCQQLSRLHLIVLRNWPGGDLRDNELYLPRLRTLAIQCWGRSRFPLDTLELLEACPRLEALYFACQDTEVSTPLHPLALSLRHLRTLELQGSPWFIHSMLENLGPLTRIIDLTVVYTTADEANLPWPSQCLMPSLQRFSIRIENNTTTLPDLVLLQSCRDLRSLAIDAANIPTADVPRQLSLFPNTLEEVTWLALDSNVMVVESMLYSANTWLPNLLRMSISKGAFAGLRAVGALRMCTESIGIIDTLLAEQGIAVDTTECFKEARSRLRSLLLAG